MSDSGDTRGAPPAERLRTLWLLNKTPDLDAFVAALGPLKPMDLATVLRVDQAERWQRGMPVAAEGYLRRFPRLADDPEAVLDLVFNEYLLAESAGGGPDPESFYRRFPRHAETLRLQIDLHRALAAGSPPTAAGAGAGEPTLIAPPGPLRPPQHFGRYRILGVLGRGGMGTVYLAHDSELDRKVALKIPSFPPGDPAPLDRFLREARIAAGFHHPHLCPVFDVGSTGGRHYLTMPIIPGESLAARLATRGRFAPAEAVGLVATVARAVAVAHAASVIHRDLKPANIMIGPAGEPVVMDFGLAKGAATAGDGLTASGMFIGTPAYAAPEQIAGEESLTAAADVYALGAILYELLTGHVPFVGPAQEVMRRKLTEDPDPPSRSAAGIGPDLDRVCLKALERAASRRFSSVEEFASALDRCAAAVAAPRSGRRRTLAAAAAGLLAITALAVGFWPRGEPVPNPNAPPGGAPNAGTGNGGAGNQGAATGDLLPAGSRWVGEHSFDPDRPATWAPAAMFVTHRDGKNFRGVCETYDGDFSWEVEGTAADGRIRWKYTRPIREKYPTNSVQNGANAEGTYDAAAMEVKYHDPGDNSRAVIRLRRSEREPKPALVHAARGERYNDAGLTDRAIEECNRALRKDDRCVPALVCRARSYILKQNLPSAITDLDRAIAIDPDSHAAHMIRAWAHNESGEPQKAYEDADRAIQLDPNHAEGYCQRGWANLGNRKYADAVTDLTKAIDSGDPAGWPYYLRGKAHKALGNTTNAEKDFATARKLDKNLPPPE